MHPGDPQGFSRPIVRARLGGGSEPARRASGGRCSIQTGSRPSTAASGPLRAIGGGALPDRVPAKSLQPPLALKRKLANRCRTVNDLSLPLTWVAPDLGAQLLRPDPHRSVRTVRWWAPLNKAALDSASILNTAKIGRASCRE